MTSLLPSIRRVLCLGDSITYGWGTVSVQRAYPERLQDALLARDGAGWSVFNRGVSGEGTTGVLSRWNNGTFDDGGARVEPPLRTLVPAVEGGWHTLVLLIGVNDVSSGAPASSIYTNITTLAADALALGAKVAVCSIAPWKGYGLWSAPKQAAQDDVRAQLQAWATADTSARAFVDVYGALGDPGDPQALLPAYDSGDHLHPNDAGAVALQTAVLAALDAAGFTA